MVAHRDIEKFGKKLFGECDVEDVLQRLDRLTRDEARTAAAQTLKVVHGLVEKMKTYVDGEQSCFRLSMADRCPDRSLDGNLNASTNNIHEALSMFYCREMPRANLG
jgi:hypothetical protein